MDAYKSFLKALGLLLLIPIVVGVTIVLGYIGLGLDFVNVFSGRGDPTIYILILPIGFLAVIAWGAYTLNKQSSMRRMQAQETVIRQKVYREQQLGSTLDDNVLHLLAQRGGMTAKQLADACRVGEDEMFIILRAQMQAGAVGQDVSRVPSVFALVRPAK